MNADAPEIAACGLFELRRYGLHPGRREPLIALFDREFVETQEAVGMAVVGQFRDRDAPDDFVWIRGFPDMERRAESLSAFYGGPVWAAHSDAANATMITYDDVHLLRRLDGDFGLSPRAPVGAAEGGTVEEGTVVDGTRRILTRDPGAGDKSADADGRLVVATLFHLAPAAAGDFPALFAATLAPRMAAAGLTPFVTLATEPAENTWPRLPVHAGKPVLVALARAAGAEAHAVATSRLVADDGWTTALAAAAPLLTRPPEVFRLSPTRRSRLR